MERGKIERETKREKKISLGWNARRRKEQSFATFKKIVKEERAKCCHPQEDSQGRESKGLPPSRRLPRMRE